MYPGAAKSDLGVVVGLSGGYPKATPAHFPANRRIHNVSAYFAASISRLSNELSIVRCAIISRNDVAATWYKNLTRTMEVFITDGLMIH